MTDDQRDEPTPVDPARNTAQPDTDTDTHTHTPESSPEKADDAVATPQHTSSPTLPPGGESFQHPIDHTLRLENDKLSPTPSSTPPRFDDLHPLLRGLSTLSEIQRALQDEYTERVRLENENCSLTQQVCDTRDQIDNLKAKLACAYEENDEIGEERARMREQIDELESALGIMDAQDRRRSALMRAIGQLMDAYKVM